MRHMRRPCATCGSSGRDRCRCGMPTGPVRTKAFDRAKASGIDVSGIVETVSHRLQPGRAGLVAKDNRYRQALR